MITEFSEESWPGNCQEPKGNDSWEEDKEW